MQDDEKILTQAIAKTLIKLRKKTGKSLNLFCNEYSIPTSTLNGIERSIISPKVFSLYKILKAYNINAVDFFKMIEHELPKGFMDIED